jgi:hypothetical protein
LLALVVLLLFACAFPVLSENLLSCRSISSPLCAAAVTFFAAAKKVTKESSVTV